MLSLDKCYDHCRSIALSHYENFPVGSILLPKKVRKHVFALYAFMRTADDIADLPVRSQQEKLSALHEIRRALNEGSEDPIIIAVHNTIVERSLDQTLLERLLQAFEFDAKGHVEFETFEDLRSYTARSAEPVGKLILQLFGYRDPGRFQFSNEITSALQLLNFLQDAREDLAMGRCYFPKEDLHRYGIDSATGILAHPNAPKLLGFEADRVRSMLEAGKTLPELVNGRLRYELRAVLSGAFALLEKLEASGWTHISTQGRRPVLSKLEHLGILMCALTGRV